MEDLSRLNSSKDKIKTTSFKRWFFHFLLDKIIGLNEVEIKLNELSSGTKLGRLKM